MNFIFFIINDAQLQFKYFYWVRVSKYFLDNWKAIGFVCWLKDNSESGTLPYFFQFIVLLQHIKINALHHSGNVDFHFLIKDFFSLSCSSSLALTSAFAEFWN